MDELARVTHGYVGADLSALCQEAALAALQRFISSPSDSAALRARVRARLVCTRARKGTGLVRARARKGSGEDEGGYRS